MTICNGRLTHEEIVHEGWDCPLCTALSDHDTKQSELESEVEDLRKQLGQLNPETWNPISGKEAAALDALRDTVRKRRRKRKDSVQTP